MKTAHRHIRFARPAEVRFICGVRSGACTAAGASPAFEPGHLPGGTTPLPIPAPPDLPAFFRASRPVWAAGRLPPTCIEPVKNKLLIVTDLGVLKAYEIVLTPMHTPRLEPRDQVVLEEQQTA